MNEGLCLGKIFQLYNTGENQVTRLEYFPAKNSRDFPFYVLTALCAANTAVLFASYFSLL